MADADHLRLVSSAAQKLAWFSRLQSRDNAADLARADIEHRDDAGTARRSIPLATEPTHILRSGFLPAFDCSVSAALRRTAASGVNWKTNRSAKRMSTAAISRERTPLSLSIARISSIASVSPLSGSLIVTPLSRRRSHRRS